jgi:peptidyl-prolyl cis-trans isomerase D
VEKARPQVESIIRNQEKGKLIANKVKSGSTLEAIAQANGQQVLTEDSIMFSTPFIPNVGQEPKVIGAAFNKSLVGKISPAIVGNGGVFVIKADNQSAVTTAAGDVGQQQAEMIVNLRRAYGNPTMVNEILKKTVTIKDNRYKFF